MRWPRDCDHITRRTRQRQARDKQKHETRRDTHETKTSARQEHETSARQLSTRQARDKDRRETSMRQASKHEMSRFPACRARCFRSRLLSFRHQNRSWDDGPATKKHDSINENREYRARRMEFGRTDQVARSWRRRVMQAWAWAERRTMNVFVALEDDVAAVADQDDPSASQRVE